MTDTPRFSYFVSPGKTRLDRNSALWYRLLPMSRHSGREEADISLRHGEYFQSIRNFLENDGCDILCHAVTLRLDRTIRQQDIQDIRICLEKHGEFYHPARLEVLAGQHKVSFVLNVAVSATGIEGLEEEYRSLSRLNHEFPTCFVPEVYGCGKVQIREDRKIRMFLGRWFDGYHEFHISRDPVDQKNKILVWDDVGGRHFLSLEQTADLYRQAARIITYYYGVVSFEQIFPWHHGAGDFVVNIEGDDLDVRLISARGYGPLFSESTFLKSGEKNVELVLQALLIFFLNLCVHMRLDRLGGVGDLAWADGLAVQSTIEGFFEGLALKPSVAFLPVSLTECFRYYLSACTKEDLYELSKSIVGTSNPRPDEVRIIRQHLKAHVEELNRCIARLLQRWIQ